MLIVSFLLLVGVVVWLGWSSEGKVQQVSKAIQDREQGQAFKTKTLLQLQNALTDLNDRARHREEQLQRHDEQGDIIIPFEKDLGRARDEVRAQLPIFDRLPVAQEAQGRVFRQKVEEFLRVTEDPRSYSLAGFPPYRDAYALIRQFIARSQDEQEQLVTLRLNKAKLAY